MSSVPSIRLKGTPQALEVFHANEKSKELLMMRPLFHDTPIDPTHSLWAPSPQEASDQALVLT